MSFYDAFRGFFGFPGPRRPRDPLFGGSAWDDEEEEEDDGPFLARPPRDFGFGAGGSRGAFQELFRDVGEFLGVFWGPWAGPPQPFEPPLPGPAERRPGQPLRDSMLKHPDGPERGSDPAPSWGPFLEPEDTRPAPPSLKEDQDLDSQVSSAGLGTILRPDEPKSRSYFQSVSITKVTLPDGAVEERRTVQDSQGRRETTVTVWRGDQTFVTTTKEDGQSKDGREEAGSTCDRELFAGAWPRQDDFFSPDLSDPSSALGSFFRRWFSSW